MKSGRFTQARSITARCTRTDAGEPGALSIGYRAEEDRWWLWWPCAQCGGVQLPLAFRPGLHEGVTEVRDLAARLMAERACPACETRTRRERCGSGVPGVWYDTQLGDWVVRLPDGRGAEAILPLEIRWFDASEALVYRTASDIAHWGDVFES